MQISLSWLKDYINLDLSVDQVSEILTAIGLEVEGVDEKELVPGGLKGVVVGEVLTCGKHPNADKLSLTTVNVGAEETLQIVCGAPNVAAGQKVLVATIGTMLYPSEGDPFKIKKGKIRGELSEGMICAEDELGLGDDHSGIIVLQEDAKVGQAAAEHYQLENETVFEIGLTPNRSDGTCHFGVAEDLAAYIKVNIDPNIAVKKPSINNFEIDHASHRINVVLENEQSCPRYSGVILTDISVKESPDWLKNKLRSIGQRPINNIVDITNFILHELGQPLHAFDLGKIGNNEIRVKNLPEGSKFVTLDEIERSLSAEDLMICDGNDQGMCIGGVFGGLKSGVTEETTAIFLEAAHFHPKSIRRSMSRHGLWTDAARVFEKGSDPNNTVYALKRAAMLIVDLAGAKVSSEITDLYPEEIQAKEIHLRYEKLNDLIGDDIPKDDIHQILSAMNMEIEPVDDHGIKVKVPTNKYDVTREVDLIEEVLRIYGFNKVSIPEKVSSSIQYSDHPERSMFREKVSEYLSSNGWNEMMGLSIIESRKCLENLDIEDKELVYINNTSNIHLDVMRPDMMLSGLSSVLNNQNHQQSDLRVYEIGKSYKQGEDSFIEEEWITMFMMGARHPMSWRASDKNNVDLLDLRSELESMIGRLGLKPNRIEQLEDSRFDICIELYVHNQPLARLGSIKRSILSNLGIKSEVVFAEIPWNKLHQFTKRVKIKTSELNKYPSVSRDLSMIIDQSIKFDDILQASRKIDKKILKSVSLFDEYVNEEHLGAGKKSYAINYVFEDASKTLKDKEVDKIIDKLIKQYEQQFSAVVRGV